MVEKILEQVQYKSPQDILKVVMDMFPSNRLLLASSLGVEDQVLTHMMISIQPKSRVFVLDTGRLHQETYDVMDRMKKQFGVHYEIGFPDPARVKALLAQKGPNSFYESIENRKECCHIRKVDPLNQLLSTADAWITGLRRDQSMTRASLDEVEWDEAHNMIKINPLVSWTVDQVWDYIKEHSIPYNALHDQGFPSIGCAPCTRAINDGEDIRAGRWWWENPDQKECGLHVVDGKLVRKAGKINGPFG